MKRSKYISKHFQQGVALPIVMVILVLSAMIVLYLASTSKKEQQISADQYRTEQSLNAAMAGLDWAVDYYNEKGLDANNDGVVDYAPPIDPSGDLSDTDAEPCESNCKANRGCPKRWCIGSDVSTDTAAIDASGDLIVKSRTFFCKTDADEDSDGIPEFVNNPEKCTKEPDINDSDNVGIVSIGYSDDNTARRVVSVKVKALSPFPGGGPNTPFTTHGNAELVGTVNIINRYYDYNIWAGGKMTFGESDAKSYIRDRDMEKGLTPPDRFHEDNRVFMTDEHKSGSDLEGALPASFAKRGNNADVIDVDPILNNLVSHAEAAAESPSKDVNCNEPRTDGKEYFFCAFFAIDNKEVLQVAAELIGQDFTGEDCGDIKDGDPSTGSPYTGIVYWKGGECKINGNASVQIGTPEEPVILFIDGDLNINGALIHGIVYVTGSLTIAGNFVIKGSTISEGGMLKVGGGGNSFIYDIFAASPNEGFNGFRGIVPNTWRDWELN